MGSQIKLEVVLDRHGRRLCVDTELSIWLVEDAIKKLDLPSVRSDTLSRLLCDSAATIEATMKARQTIAAALTKAIVDAMGAGDTCMGYPRAHNKVEG